MKTKYKQSRAINFYFQKFGKNLGGHKEKIFLRSITMAPYIQCNLRIYFIGADDLTTTMS